MKIKLIHKQNIGSSGFYPVNKNATALAKFIKSDTFTSNDIKTMKALGHEVEYVPSQSFPTTTTTN